MTEAHVIDRFFAALASGDLAGAGDCLAHDARVWHGFDGIAQDRASILAAFGELIAQFPERGIADVRRQPTPSGYVQQHLFVVRSQSGQRIAWPVCVVVQVVDGRITRLDEYIDRAGSFDPGEGALVTPGM